MLGIRSPTDNAASPPAPATSSPASYRVEFWAPQQEAVIIAVISGIARHHRSLDQFVSRLLQDGSPGVVALVDHESDTVIARRQVTRAKTR